MNKTTYKLNQTQLQRIEREQANKVALWRIEKPNGKFDDVQKREKERHKLLIYFKIQNNSNLPIYNIVILNVTTAVSIKLNNISKYYNHNIYPGYEEKHYAYSRILEPGESYGYMNGNGSGMGNTDDFVYFFRDVKGIAWFRSNTGQLEKVGTLDDMINLLNRLGIMASDLSNFEHFGKY